VRSFPLTLNFERLNALVNKPIGQERVTLDEKELYAIEQIAKPLPHNKLRGHRIETENELLQLQPYEIDLARGLLLSQLEGRADKMAQIRSYEATLDLMALQILARVPSDASPETKIRTINTFIFEEMGFRFPPHSLYSKEIDLYTFLPSVLDSHRGVCLG